MINAKDVENLTKAYLHSFNTALNETHNPSLAGASGSNGIDVNMQCNTAERTADRKPIGSTHGRSNAQCSGSEERSRRR